MIYEARECSWEIPKEEITRIYVIRRGLRSELFNHYPRLREFSHSALLYETNQKNFYVIEFMEDGNVYNYQVRYQVKEIRQDHEIVIINSETWTKQLVGSSVTSKISPDEAKNLMERLMPNDYHIYN